MKKQFFYAALAIGMMSSCSSNDLPGNQAPEEQLPEEEKVAIELGVNSLNAVITTRGTGFAGNEKADANAKWDKQPLGILMVKKINTSNQALWKALDGSTYMFNGLEFSAPSAENTSQVGSTQNGAGKITNQLGAVRYYPLQGAYDFFGWHIDDARETTAIDVDTWEGTTSVEAPVTTLSTELTIDGTQDIMVGKAVLSDTQKSDLTPTSEEQGQGLTQEKAEERAYSSWAARRTVQPIIKFEHVLARLDFKAVLGQNIGGGAKIKVDSDYDTQYRSNEADQKIYPEAVDDGGIKQIDNGVYVKSIKVLNPKDKFTLVVADVNKDNLGISGAASKSGDNTSFELKRKPTDSEKSDSEGKSMRQLTPVNAGYQAPASAEDYKKVGDGIMIVPGENSFEMEVTLMQYVLTVDPNDATDPSGIEAKHEWKEATMKTIVKLDNNKIFEKGKFYTVNIKMYGFQKIEVNAELAAWTSGGDINSNPEDENFRE